MYVVLGILSTRLDNIGKATSPLYNSYNQPIRKFSNLSLGSKYSLRIKIFDIICYFIIFNQSLNDFWTLIDCIYMMFKIATYILCKIWYLLISILFVDNKLACI